MKGMILFLVCLLVASCVNRSKQKEDGVSEALINHAVEKNDTLGLVWDNLRGEETVEIKDSESQKQPSGTMSF